MTHSLPDGETLRRVLTVVLNRSGSARGRLIELRRQRLEYGATFHCEILRTRFEDGSRLALLSKYARRDGSHSHGHRGGVAYEAEVYRRVLHPCGGSTPAFYGSYTESATGSTWLFLEYVNRSMLVDMYVDKGDGLAAMKKAVGWIARFHAAQQARLKSDRKLNLTRYDANYYVGWAQRTAEFSGHWHRRFPWLARRCRQLEQELPALAARPQTVIHGEYYPHNILLQRGVVRPVDWETAAVGTGEIDLATITEDWPREISREFEQEYQRARWPQGAPGDFERTLDLARAYMQLRWLGDDPKSTKRKSSKRWHFQQISVISKRLGLR